MKIEEAKGLIDQLLKKVEVGVVYYIDDYLSYESLHTIMTYIEETPDDQLRNNITVIPEEIINTKSIDPDIRQKIQSWWDELSDSQREKIICECVPSQEPKVEDQIRQLFDEKCIMCSPSQWENIHSHDCLKKISNKEKVLLLFDQRLDTVANDRGEGRTGLSLAQSFSGHEGVKENSFCGIFSHSFEIDEEFKFRNENHDKLSSWAFPLSKKRISSDGDYALFIDGLNNLFWVNDVDHLSNIAKNIIDETSKKIIEEFNKILPLEFKQIIIDSSTTEGCREIDTLLRLIHIIFQRELQRSLSKDDSYLYNFNQKSECIKQLDAVFPRAFRQNPDIPHYNKDIVNNFFQDETFVPGNVVNKLLMPLQNGDVFYVNNSSFYVLLCQPCTISIRDKGERSGNDTGYFVPLKESKVEGDIDKIVSTALRENITQQTKNELKEKINKTFRINTYSYNIKCSINNKSLCAFMNKFIPIPLSLLDYCTFSDDGKVIINKKCSPNLHKNQKMLNENNTKKFEKLLDLDYLVSGLNEDCHAIIKPKIESWFYSFLLKLGCKPKYENYQYIFPIVRYGHIQDPLASDLLTQLSHYISRAALPSEFDR